jgi:hypothetical protein
VSYRYYNNGGVSQEDPGTSYWDPPDVSYRCNRWGVPVGSWDFPLDVSYSYNGGVSQEDPGTSYWDPPDVSYRYNGGVSQEDPGTS